MSVTVRFYRIPVYDVVAFAGGGFYMPWIMGAAEGVGARLPRGAYRVAGVSAGAVAAVLLACDVDIHAANALVLQRRDLFDRSLGGFGVLRSAMESWLHVVLPEDAARRCSGRLTVVLYKVGFGHTTVNEFRSKADVIAAVIASGFLPLYSDLTLTTEFRRDLYVDGAAFGERNSYFANIGKHVLVVDHNDDACAVRDSPWFRVGTPRTWVRRLHEGRAYAYRIL